MHRGEKSSTSQESLRSWDFGGLLLSSTASLSTKRDLPRGLYPFAHHTLTQLLEPWPGLKTEAPRFTTLPFRIAPYFSSNSSSVHTTNSISNWAGGMASGPPQCPSDAAGGQKSFSHVMWRCPPVYAPWPVEKRVAEVAMIQRDDRGYLRDPYDKHHIRQNLSQSSPLWLISCDPKSPGNSGAAAANPKASGNILLIASIDSHQIYQNTSK